MKIPRNQTTGKTINTYSNHDDTKRLECRSQSVI